MRTRRSLAHAAIPSLALALLLAAPGAGHAASPGQPATDRGVERFKAGDFEGARTAFREAVRLDPGHLKAWENLGWAEHRLGRRAEAMRIWRRILTLDPERESTREAIAAVEAQETRAREREEARAERLAAEAEARERAERQVAAQRRERAERQAAAQQRQRAEQEAAAREAAARERERERERLAAASRREGAEAPAPGAPPGDPEAAGDAAFRRGDHAAAARGYRVALEWRRGDPQLLLKLGRAVAAGGELEEALELWRRAAAAPSSPPAVHVDLAEALFRLDQDDEARHEYERALAVLAQLGAGERARVAALGFRAGDLAGAERALAAVFEADPQNPRWSRRAADLYAMHDQPDRGAAFLGGPAVPPGLAGRPQALARLHVAQGARAFAAQDFDGAARAYERALAVDPRSPTALRDLGWAHRRAGRLDDARRAWERYAREHPALAAPHDLLAELHLQRGAFEEALAASRASLAADPAGRGPALRTIRSLYGLSRYAEGRRLAAQLAARFPDDPQPKKLLAQGLTVSRDFEGAARTWRSVVELEPDSVQARLSWIRALYDAGHADEAVREARRLARAPDAPPPVLELLAQDALARGELADAVRWYRELTRRVPEQLGAWRTLGATLGRLGRHEEQAAVAREAMARLPGRMEFRLDLVTALSSLGRHDEAADVARALLREFPDSGTAFDSLVAQLSAAGRLSEALRLLSRNHPSFFKEFDRRMIEASLRARQNDFSRAARLLRSVAEPGPGVRYVPVVVYHGIVDQERTLQIPPGRFEEHMAALAARGYQAITLTELARMLDGQLPFPARPILVTFDDARADSFAHADPALARHGFKATMFVPTARIGAEDGFHVSWDTLERHVRSGRWDLQAHGHVAHDPIDVDARGSKGAFLTYRAWLPAERRLETPEEWTRRIDEDHRRCKAELERRFPGRPVLGYAYPLNLIGQAQPGPIQGPPSVNEVLGRRHFRFGFVQDDSGYNLFRAGAPAPFLIRRLDVESGWSGEELVARLARREPETAARLALARLTVDEGRPRAAREMIGRLVHDEPLVAGDARWTLAQIAWDEDRTREAAAHLALAPPVTGRGRQRADRLSQRLAWRNATRVGAEALAYTDSDGQTVRFTGLSMHHPLRAPVELQLRGGDLRLLGPDGRGLAGLELSGGATLGIGHQVDVSAWGRHRQLTYVPDSVNGGVAVRARGEQHVLSIRWSHEDVDTVLAQVAGIDSTLAAAKYEFRTPRWRLEGTVSRRAFDDGNARDDVELTVLRTLGAAARWAVGATLAYDDSRFDPEEYWTPRDLVQAAARVRYRRSWPSGAAVALDVAGGAAEDPVNGTRPTGQTRLQLTRWWGASRRIGTSLGVTARAVPGYRSVEGGFQLEGRL